MRTSVRAVAVGVATVLAGLVLAGAAHAQPLPPEPPLTPADQEARLACLAQYLDFGELPRQSLQDPAAFSLLVTQAAQACDPVRAEPSEPSVPAG